MAQFYIEPRIAHQALEFALKASGPGDTIIVDTPKQREVVLTIMKDTHKIGVAVVAREAGVLTGGWL